MLLTEKIYNSFLRAPYMFWWYPLTPSYTIINKNKESSPLDEYFYACGSTDDFLVLICDNEIRVIAFDVIEYINCQREYFI